MTNSFPEQPTCQALFLLREIWLPTKHKGIYDCKNKSHFDNEQWINCEFLPHSTAPAKFLSTVKRHTLPHRRPARTQHTYKTAFRGVLWKSEPKAQSIRALGNRNHSLTWVHATTCVPALPHMPTSLFFSEAAIVRSKDKDGCFK